MKKPEKNMPASKLSMANCTACVSDPEIIDSTMPSASDASSTSEIAAASQTIWPCIGTSSTTTAAVTNDAPTASPTSR